MTKILIQTAFIFVLTLVCNAFAAVLPFIMPGSVLAMIVLFILLLSGIIKTEQIKENTEFLQQNMGFFLLPPGVILMDYFPLLADIIVPLLVIIIVSTVLTFVATGWTVQFVIKLQEYFRVK